METNAFPKTFKELKRFGLLMLSDARLPSITTLVAGQPIRGSWWGHARGHDIFRVASRIAEHPDVAATKLVSGKITFVHRKLWPALLAIATARDAWQMNGLSRKARNLLQIVDRKREIRADQLPKSPKTSRSPWRQAVQELEERLLVYAEEFHSETGAHAKRLESWQHWAKRIDLALVRLTLENARKDFEKIIQKLNSEYNTNARLPWKEM
jgi:hypothetical protein